MTGGGLTNTAASYVWAAFQSHVVMAEYSAQNIRHHPLISFIFVQFLVQNHVTEPQKEVANLRKEVSTLKSKIDKALKRLDELKTP